MKPAAPGSFKDLWVWQRSLALVLELLTLTQPLYDDDQSGVLRELCSCAVRIPAKIARAVAMTGHRMYQTSLMNAYGYTQEVETQLRIATEIGLISRAAADRAQLTNDEVAQMLVSMLNSPQLTQDAES
jgi:four helix bundle protein